MINFCLEIILYDAFGRAIMLFLKDLSDIMQKIVMSMGIIVGGIWTYLLFIRQRVNLPKVKIYLKCSEVKLPYNKRLINIEIRMKNVGSVILKSDFAELRLCQIIPIPEFLEEIKNKNIDPVEEGKTEIEWPMIAEREWIWEKGKFEIEPGENDSIHSDFVIPMSIKAVQYYFFLHNSRKKGKGIGWTLTKIFNLNRNGEIEMNNNKKSSVKKSTKIIEQQSRKTKQKQVHRKEKQQARKPRQQQTQPKKK